MTLQQHLDAALGQPFDYQHLDCCRWIDAWVTARGYESPMQAIGILYDSERSALRRIREGGGLVALWSRGMEAVGVPVADEPRPGDVGIIQTETDDGTGEACAIRLGARWVSLEAKGLHIAPAPHLIVWRP